MRSTLAHSTPPDDGFREIQLNGKQLVFLFMGATVVSVVIFLCGVLVGRGLRPVSGEPLAASSEPVGSEPSGTVPSDVLASGVPPASAGTPLASTEPPPTPDELSYYDRLKKNNPPVETLKPADAVAPKAVEDAPVPSAVGGDQQQSVSTEKAVPTTAGNAGVPTAGAGYAVQVAALRAQGEADAIAKRLSGKGYPAYVMSPAPGAPAAVFRVRVGKFSSRREAEQVAARLEKEEQFKPWIIR